MKKLDISKSEMQRMREQGLSNKDIAALLDISQQTVYRYIGPQGCKMDSLSAFTTVTADRRVLPTEIPEPVPEVVDRLSVVYEKVKSADGNFTAEFDYESRVVSLLGDTFGIEQLPELVTFIVGLAARVNNH